MFSLPPAISTPEKYLKLTIVLKTIGLADVAPLTEATVNLDGDIGLSLVIVHATGQYLEAVISPE